MCGDSDESTAVREWGDLLEDRQVPGQVGVWGPRAGVWVLFWFRERPLEASVWFRERVSSRGNM